ncbi:MAG: cysteine desulfurase family protein [Flavobacterium sp.]|nr:cysteine desulfurase family protein [Flavobacterium sp.]
MKKVYLDNAATTQMRPEVIQEMVKIMTEDYGNPSSTHSFGRTAKNNLELSRKAIAKHLNCTAQEIIFTSGATEANNWILRTAVKDLKVQRIITTKIEHHAVLHAIEKIQKEYGFSVEYLRIKPNGTIDLSDLTALLSDGIPTLVSLMHVNNETGVVIDLQATAKICKQYHAYFHSDTVQSVGKTTFDLQQLPIDFLTASAHKFHGPKGIGFAFIRKGLLINPLFYGGEQEKGLRPGTESVHNIVGMAKALELSYGHLTTEKNYIFELKEYAFSQLQTHFPGTTANGNFEATFYNILNVLLPFSEEKTIMILFHLDMKGIAVSRGSACQSGSIKPSHVLAEMLSEEAIKQPSLRISFSHFNTKEDIDDLVTALQSL